MRYVAQLQKRDRWEDALYTDDKHKATRFVKRMVETHPQVKDGRVIDTQEKRKQR